MHQIASQRNSFQRISGGACPPDPPRKLVAFGHLGQLPQTRNPRQNPGGASYPLIDKTIVITEPARPSARLLGLSLKLFPSTMERMLNEDLTRFMPIS